MEEKRHIEGRVREIICCNIERKCTVYHGNMFRGTCFVLCIFGIMKDVCSVDDFALSIAAWKRRLRESASLMREAVNEAR